MTERAMNCALYESTRAGEVSAGVADIMEEEDTAKQHSLAVMGNRNSILIEISTMLCHNGSTSPQTGRKVVYVP